MVLLPIIFLLVLFLLDSPRRQVEAMVLFPILLLLQSLKEMEKAVRSRNHHQ
jgi:hypothetical protein